MAPLSKAEVISDANSLAMPAIGDHGLRVISSTVLELTLINTKVSHPAKVSAWDFVNEQGIAALPALSQFVVTVNGQHWTFYFGEVRNGVILKQGQCLSCIVGCVSRFYQVLSSDRICTVAEVIVEG